MDYETIMYGASAMNGALFIIGALLIAIIIIAIKED